MANKLELTWFGKENKQEIEPRLLIERSDLSYEQKSCSLFDDATYDNLLIHGDNLLGLKALIPFYAGKIKCIYIDPPYNTGAAFEHYDDNVEHSTWLSLMRDRLVLLRELLSDDGMLFCQIDDNEQAYLTVLMDEIFGRNNRINTICVNMSNMSGPKVNNAINGKRFPKIKEYILLYAKDKDSYSLTIPKQNKAKWDSEYNMIIPELSEENSIALAAGELDEKVLKTLTIQSLKKYMADQGLKENDDEWKFNNAYRIVASKPNVALLKAAKEMNFDSEIAYIESSRGLKRFIKTDFNRETSTARIELTLASEHLTTFFGDHWDDIVTTGGVAQEGDVVFKASKKPEKLIARVIECCTKENDWVLDSFLGSGTTAAVAHKMRRKWIGIEMGDHAYTHCKKRLDTIIDGKDPSGVTDKYKWEGGGGYKFYEIAPTLINIDAFGQAVINKEYNSDMLAAAVAIHEGFRYQPDKDCYWKQAKNEKNTYLYVTTNHVTEDVINSIKAEMQEDEFLVLVCKSYDESLKRLAKNITIKKIPQSLLKNCEFGVDNYDLNIVCPPEYDYDEEVE